MTCIGLTAVAATAAKHLLTTHGSNVGNGVSAGGTLVLKHLSVRPSRLRRRSQFPDIAQDSLAACGPEKAVPHAFFCASVHECRRT
jgi:hypothetical protein